MISIIDYGVGNLRSVQKAFESFGSDAVITGSPETILNSSHVVLPGVGAFKGAMSLLKESGLKETIFEFVKSGRPLLGICLGMQLLCERSYENGVFRGLGLIPGEIERFGAGLKVPEVGWNRAKTIISDPLFNGIDDQYFYFVHSYRYTGVGEYTLATTEYGEIFTSAVKKGNIYGVQFHPEKSGEYGIKLLQNFAAIN